MTMSIQRDSGERRQMIASCRMTRDWPIAIAASHEDFRRKPAAKPLAAL
ncbi:hypothetical protein ACLIIZ_15660 [Azonexus caeni]|jgi:hypothetical protein